MRRLAIVSPRQTAITETFIQAHRDIPNMDIRFYFGGLQHAQLEGYGPLLDLSLASRVRKKLKNPLSKFDFSPAQEAFAESLLKEEVDCILAEYGMTGVQVMPIAKALNIPLFVHFHGFDAVMKSVINDIGKDYTKMFSIAKGIIAVSKKMVEKLEELGCPPNKIHLNTYGANPEFLKVEPTYSEKLFVGLGRFVDKKAPYYTILAFQKVLANHPDAKLVIGGDGELYDTCVNLVQYFEMENSVRLPGVLKPEEYRSLLSRCRGFVQHSITPSSGDMEGTPLSVLEAQAAGVPVIGSIHAGIPDVVLHEETGLLFEEHDVYTMARHMESLINAPEKCRELGMAGRERIINHFSVQRHLNELGRIIEKG